MSSFHIGECSLPFHVRWSMCFEWLRVKLGRAPKRRVNAKFKHGSMKTYPKFVTKTNSPRPKVATPRQSRKNVAAQASPTTSTMQTKNSPAPTTTTTSTATTQPTPTSPIRPVVNLPKSDILQHPSVLKDLPSDSLRSICLTTRKLEPIEDSSVFRYNKKKTLTQIETTTTLGEEPLPEDQTVYNKSGQLPIQMPDPLPVKQEIPLPKPYEPPGENTKKLNTTSN